MGSPVLSATGSCARCGRTFHRVNRGRTRLFCSDACRSAARPDRSAATPTDRGDEPFARAVADTLRHGPQGADLTALLEQQGHPVSKSTRSGWKRGLHLPPETPSGRAGVLALERALDLPPGTLIAPLAATHAARRAARREISSAPPLVRSGRRPDLRVLDGRRRGMELAIARTHGASRSLLAVTDQDESFHIGRHRLPERSSLKLSVCAMADNVRSYWYLYTYTPEAPVRIVPGAGCRDGAVLDDRHIVGKDATEVVVAHELVFPEPLALGETASFSYRLEHEPRRGGSVPEGDFFRRILTSPACRRLRLSLRFHPMAVPTEIHGHEWNSRKIEESVIETWTAELNGRYPTARIDRSCPSPRAYGWSWRW